MSSGHINRHVGMKNQSFNEDGFVYNYMATDHKTSTTRVNSSRSQSTKLINEIIMANIKNTIFRLFPSPTSQTRYILLKKGKKNHIAESSKNKIVQDFFIHL